MYKTKSLLVTSLHVLFKTSITVTSKEIMILCPALPRIFYCWGTIVIGLKGRPAKHGRGQLSNVRNIVGMTNRLVMMPSHSWPPPLPIAARLSILGCQAEYNRLTVTVMIHKIMMMMMRVLYFAPKENRKGVKGRSSFTSQLKRWIRAGIFKQSVEARNRVGIGLSYRPAWLHRPAEFIRWNRFLGSINV